MPRRPLISFVLCLLCLWPAVARAEEEPTPDDAAPVDAAPVESTLPPLADEETAEEALAVFKVDYKARGFRGIERTAMREVAMRKLARTQHPLVADALFKLTRDRDADIRTLAVMYLGEMRGLPGYAGAHIEKALEAQRKDSVFAMFAIDAFDSLGYRGAVATVRKLMTHKDVGVRKVAILYIGDAGEWRMLEDLLKLMKELKIDEGWKTEGHEVRYDTGAAGDSDQKAAEKIYRDRYGSSARKARSGGRAMRDMKPILLEAMKQLTGQDFMAGASAREWAKENAEQIEAEQKALDEAAKAQKIAADALDD